MLLSKTQTNDIFLTDSGLKWKRLISTPKEKKMHPDRYKCQRMDTKETHLLTEMIIRKWTQ